MNLHHATLVHWAEPGMRSACGATGETSYDEGGITCGECLVHLITWALENDPPAEGSLYALRLCAILARLNNPSLVVKLDVRP